MRGRHATVNESGGELTRECGLYREFWRRTRRVRGMKEKKRREYL
jgi:hypothetical protein